MFKKVMFPVTFDLDIAEIIGNAHFLAKLNINKIDLFHVVSSGLSNIVAAKEDLERMADTVRLKTNYEVECLYQHLRGIYKRIIRDESSDLSIPRI